MSENTTQIALSNGGEVEIHDYDQEIYVEITFPGDSDGITIFRTELTGNEFQVAVRERYS